MITVISLEEYKLLLRARKLAKSSNLEFLDSNGLSFLKTEYQNRTGKEAGLILYLFSLDGKEIQDVSEEVLETHTNALIANLSLPDGDAVLLITRSGMPVLKLDREIFDELSDLDLGDELEQKIAKTLLDQNSQNNSTCTYAISDCLYLDNVKAVLYSPNIQDKVLAYREEAERRNILFTATSLFNR